MDLKSQLEEFIREIDGLIDRCQTKYANIDGSSKLCRKFVAERKFLATLASHNRELKEVHLKSSNLRHLKAIVGQIESLANVTHILKVFKDKAHNVLHVDIVCDSGYTWCKAIARNAQSLHLLWKGEGQFGEKNIKNQIEEYIRFAQCNTHNFKTPKIVFYFAGGVTRELTDYLKSRDIDFKGEIVELDDATKLKLTCLNNDCSSDDDEDEEALQYESFNNEFADDNSAESDILYNSRQEDLSDIKKINLDVTTMIALVSEMTNGGENFPYKQQFLQRQSEWERMQHLNPILEDFMRGKELLVCETAHNDFFKIVNTVGGEKERDRARKLMERVEIVKDSPSDRSMQLKESSKIKSRAKVIFGTGDQLKAVTMTSNIGFVRSAEQQNIKFAAFFHESPPLTIERYFKKKTSTGCHMNEQMDDWGKK